MNLHFIKVKVTYTCFLEKKILIEIFKVSEIFVNMNIFPNQCQLCIGRNILKDTKLNIQDK